MNNTINPSNILRSKRRFPQGFRRAAGNRYDFPGIPSRKAGSKEQFIGARDNALGLAE